MILSDFIRTSAYSKCTCMLKRKILFESDRERQRESEMETEMVKIRKSSVPKWAKMRKKKKRIYKNKGKKI